MQVLRWAVESRNTGSAEPQNRVSILPVRDLQNAEGRQHSFRSAAQQMRMPSLTFLTRMAGFVNAAIELILLLANAVGGQTGIVRRGNKMVRSNDESSMPFTECFVPPSR